MVEKFRVVCEFELGGMDEVWLGLLAIESRAVHVLVICGYVESVRGDVGASKLPCRLGVIDDRRLLTGVVTIPCYETVLLYHLVRLLNSL